MERGHLLAEGEKDGFIIILSQEEEAVNRALETSKAQNDTGLEVNTEGVDSVTDGMLLDKNGQAATFTLADGSTWVADHATKTWSLRE